MLKVEGVNPDRIKCETHDSGYQAVKLDGCEVAVLATGGAAFNCWFSKNRHERIRFRRRSEQEAVMNAAIDEWRASGGTRLWPEPPQEPVDCVCGWKSRLISDTDRHVFVCDRVGCIYAAYSVDEWNAIQATLKAMKGVKS